MAYTTPATASVGSILTAAIWNASVRDDTIYLQDRVDNPPRASVTHSTTQSIASATDTQVVFNTEGADAAGMHSTVSNTSRLTVPSGQGGWYLYVAYVEFDANATGQRKIALRYNGAATFAQVQVDAAAGASNTRLSLTGLVAAAATDYVEIIVSQNSGGALNLTTGCRFDAIRVA